MIPIGERQNLVPSYLFDLPNRGVATRSFTLQAYPGLLDLLENNRNLLKDLCEKDKVTTYVKKYLHFASGYKNK